MKRVKKYKISRRLQAPIFEKCQTQKFVYREQNRSVRPSRGRRPTEYGRQLVEKQKVRYLYGISEKVLKNYAREAVKSGEAEDVLVQVLERRLDNIVYQLGLALTRRMARQLVSHGHITVNGRKMTIPSYRVRDADVIQVRAGSERTSLFQAILTGKAVTSRVAWASWDAKKKSGSITDKPVIGETIFSLPAIFEYYSR
ncbi:MAG: 30S ribosomal protein S4 [Candidatus Kaiserbacteria bacterium]|nr:30S ribosomal protein S4 [Candidatus Kaiserbacteria bacterium]